MELREEILRRLIDQTGLAIALELDMDIAQQRILAEYLSFGETDPFRASRWERARTVRIKSLSSSGPGMNLWEAWIATDSNAPILLPHFETPSRKQVLRAVRVALTFELMKEKRAA